MPQNETTGKRLRALGTAIRERRKVAQLSQEALAELSNLHPTYVSRLESGRANLSFESLTRVADALGMKPSRLLDAADL